MKTTKNKSLMSLHAMNFLVFAGLSCIFPFLSVHIRDLGLTIRDSIYVNLSASILSGVMPIVIGYAAERRGRYKLCLCTSLLLAGISYTSLLAVPRTLRLPRQPLVDFDCSAAVNIEKCPNWATCSDAANAWPESIFRLSYCRYKCSSAEKSQNTTYPLHICFHSSETSNNLCLVYEPDSQDSSSLEFHSRLSLWRFSEYRNVSVSEFVAMDPRTAPFSVDVCSFTPDAPNLIVNGKQHDSMFCRPLPEGCTIKCLLSIQSQKTGLRTSPCQEVVGDPQLTFWLYLGIRSCADACLLCVLCLLDAVFVQSINDFRGAYGRSRLWPALALAACPPAVGALVDYYSKVAERPDYSPAYFVFAGFILISCALVIAVPLQVGTMASYTVSPSRHPAEEPKLWSLNLIVTIIISVLFGTFWGFSESYLPWFYSELGFNNLLLGFTQTVTFVCSLPFLAIAKNMVHNIGEANLLAVSFAFYALRYDGISFINDTWWATPFEAMETFTLSIMWIAIVAQGQSLVSKDYRVTLQNMLNVAHFCIGRGVGCTLGGFLTEHFGFRVIFRATSVTALIAALIYLALHHLWLKPRHRSKMAARRNAQHIDQPVSTVNSDCYHLDRRIWSPVAPTWIWNVTHQHQYSNGATSKVIQAFLSTDPAFSWRNDGQSTEEWV